MGSYQPYGGNPSLSDGDARYGAQDTYAATNLHAAATGYGGSNAYDSSAGTGMQGGYGTGGTQDLSPPPSRHEASHYSQVSAYPPPQPPLPTQASNTPHPLPAAAPTLTIQDFLTRVDGVRSEIRTLTANISEIGSLHQRFLSSPEASSSTQLAHRISQTQILNTRIRDQIRYLEADAVRTGTNASKGAQVNALKAGFRSQLGQYQEEERMYRQRYREQIARQYRIVNPEASDEEVRQAQEANWGDEGVFQTALKTNRTAAATSVLTAVRARHNDIQQIERTLIELSQLFQDLGQVVVLQEAVVQRVDERTEQVKLDTEAGNVQLGRGVKSAERARKLKWIVFWVVILIICVLALALGLGIGLTVGRNKGTSS